MSSILVDTKKVCGIDDSYKVFDLDFVLYINSVFSTLSQLGIGPEMGFAIEDATQTWDDFFEGEPDNRLNSVKTYMSLRVRLLFDPPTTSYLIESFQKQVQELEWRLNVFREGSHWTAPSVTTMNGDSP